MLSIDLKNKVAIVTGVSQGVGAGVAKMLAKAGCKVMGCALAHSTDHGAMEFIKTAESEGAEAKYLEADVTSHADLKLLVAETLSEFGQIDILVSNAGVNIFKGGEKCTSDEWDFNQNLNLKSHWVLSKLCKPYLDKSDSGVILIMASVHAYQTIKGCFPYNIAKTALTGLVRSLAIEWGPKIRTVGIAPGYIETPGVKKWFNSFADPDAERNRTIELHPVKKLGTAEEIGAFCAFLASPLATFSSGTTYVVDGGRSALVQDE